MLNEIDLSRADLNLLVLFEAVWEERHVGRAAEKLNLSASAVSHGLRRLRRLLNDPLFLRTAKGVVPTARGKELEGPIAEILVRARSVFAAAAPFDAATSQRRFAIGAPDGISAVLLLPLLARLRRVAPSIDLSLSQLLPSQGGKAAWRAWEQAFAELEARAVDIAILPVDSVPARFSDFVLYEEKFVIAARAGHPFASAPTLDHYCALRHLVVSRTGDAHGFVDEALAGQGMSRRVALTVPSFMLALAVIAGSDLIAAMPGSIVAMHARRFGLVSMEAPLPLPFSRIRAIAPKAAMMDAGIAWLLKSLREAVQLEPDARKKRAPACVDSIPD
ncbi:MAG: LysR substrate-binding domain-containing protein [Beijerinckiaceae bacterium]|nr:LysR substrate-binding domain-containing protein [Beijerinckiaceae bacterium]